MRWEWVRFTHNLSRTHFIVLFSNVSNLPWGDRKRGHMQVCMGDKGYQYDAMRCIIYGMRAEHVDDRELTCTWKYFWLWFLRMPSTMWRYPRQLHRLERRYGYLRRFQTMNTIRYNVNKILFSLTNTKTKPINRPEYIYTGENGLKQSTFSNEPINELVVCTQCTCVCIELYTQAHTQLHKGVCILSS